MSDTSGAGGAAVPAAPPSIGFWGSTWRHRKELLNWDLACSIAITGITRIVNGKTVTAVLPNLLVTEFAVAAALLGVVIAGLAVIVGFLSRDYAVVLMRAKEGPGGDFWPFWYVAVVAVTSILSTGVALVAINQDTSLTRLSFEVTTFLATYALLACVNLVGFVKAQGETRAYQLSLEDAVEQPRRTTTGDDRSASSGSQ